jgi:hypothetical protein
MTKSTLIYLILVAVSGGVGYIAHPSYPELEAALRQAEQATNECGGNKYSKGDFNNSEGMKF